ncbi:MAG: prolyl oligopeptidase family serine peptidase [Pseudomonadota bacterium]
MVGVEYSGLYPSYEFYDLGLGSTMVNLTEYFRGASVSLESFSRDLNDLIIHVSGANRAPSFYQYDRRTRSLERIALEYDGITDENVMPTVEVTYPARDGEKIPGVLTYPRGWNFDRRLPTLIMPHGGPEAHDSVRFDWMAQFFASRGYLILQPSFRGLDGFGAKHKLAGRGEWGRGVMQHDVTDGLNAMIKTGWADADRVCIVGASYGGYAALAGGAFTPEKYKCIAAVAPVTDLVKMTFDERRDSGSDSWVVTYWKLLIGDPRSEKERLRSISPSQFADNFTAPVLLIHGKDDTVVPISQSSVMARALKRADKPVEFVRQNNGDYWLSTSETRLETLSALSTFIDTHLGGSKAAGTP